MTNVHPMLFAAIVVTAIMAGFLGFTKTGYEVLYNLGFAAECGGGCE